MLIWLQANWVNILAAISAIMAAARAIVFLTPTPKDDAAIEKVSGWLRTIAKLFGLDVKQGL